MERLRATIRLQQYCNELGLLSFNKLYSRVHHSPSQSSRTSAGDWSALPVPKNRIHPPWIKALESFGKKHIWPNFTQKDLLEKRAAQEKGGKVIRMVQLIYLLY